MAESKQCNNSNQLNDNEDPTLNNDVELEPDIGLGFSTQSGERRGNSRREEGFISFRQFLQNSVGNTPASYPDLYRCSRQDRSQDGGNPPSESPDLPDFVQDHLAVEQLYFNNASQPPSVSLPDFASFSSRSNGYKEQSSNSNDYNENSSHRWSQTRRIPLDLPENLSSSSDPTLPFDLTNNAGKIADTHSPDGNVVGIGTRLPDFLSDSHVLKLNNTRNRDDRTSNSNRNNNEIHLDRSSTILMLRQENTALRDELNLYEGMLMKKNDRIKELEDIVMALETSKMQMSADANTQTSTRPINEQELSAVKNQPGSSKAGLSSENLPIANAEQIPRLNLNEKIKESEKLVRYLLKVITDMKNDIRMDLSN